MSDCEKYYGIFSYYNAKYPIDMSDYYVYNTILIHILKTRKIAYIDRNNILSVIHYLKTSGEINKFFSFYTTAEINTMIKINIGSESILINAAIYATGDYDYDNDTDEDMESDNIGIIPVGNYFDVIEANMIYYSILWNNIKSYNFIMQHAHINNVVLFNKSPRTNSPFTIYSINTIRKMRLVITHDNSVVLFLTSLRYAWMLSV